MQAPEKVASGLLKGFFNLTASKREVYETSMVCRVSKSTSMHLSTNALTANTTGIKKCLIGVGVYHC